MTETVLHHWQQQQCPGANSVFTKSRWLFPEPCSGQCIEAGSDAAEYQPLAEVGLLLLPFKRNLAEKH